jgi:hypothetical protein
MVRLYIWKPTRVSEVLTEGIMPDFGHAALEVVNEATGQTTYMSFWPELESLVGFATRPWKHRATRHPSSYAEETEPEAGFMQRPADFIETLHGLNERHILAAWAMIRDDEYHLRSWNCSNVSKYLLISAMTPEDYVRIAECAACTVEELKRVRDRENLREVLAYLTTSSFIDCRPDDVLRMAVAYNEQITKEADEALANAETVTLPTLSATT